MKQYRGWLLLVAFCAFGSTCSFPRRTVEVYEKDGIRFSHYSDWKITKDALAAGTANTRVIHIEGPHNALLSILCFPESSPTTLEEFAGSVADKRAAAIEDKLSVGGINLAHVARGTSDVTKALISGEERAGIRQRFTITLLNAQVPHQADFFMLRPGRYKVVLMAQAAAENLEQSQVGWQKIYETIALDGLRSAKPPI